jgi:hypothetical protein
MIVWVLLLIAAMPVLWAASPVGLMTVSGPVRISGSEFEAKAVSSWPIVAGDEIVTQERSRAVLISPRAGRLEIQHDSRVTAAQDTVVLHQGEVGAERFVVRTGVYTAQPNADAAGRSWFVVSIRSGVPVFAAHLGDVWVSHGHPSPLLVRAGTYAVPTAPSFSAPAPPAPGPPPPDAAEPAGPQFQLRPDESAAFPGPSTVAGAASTGWTVGSLNHASSVALVSGVSAAAMAGTVAGVALIEPTVTLPERSPSSSK